MLKFSAAQMAEGQIRYDRRRAVPRLVEYLRDEHPDHFEHLSDEELGEKAFASLQIARGYELSTESDIHAFITLDMVNAPGFYRDPKVEEILRVYNAPERTRMMELIFRLSTEDWSRIYQQANQSG